jgi:DNA-binding CsgD family transcriptional regulator
MSGNRPHFVSQRNGEWSPRLERPKAFDMDSAEARETAVLVEQLGFDRFIVILRFVLPVAGPLQITFCNWRADWAARYWSKGYLQIDPILTRMLTAHGPFDWQDVGPLTPAQKALFADRRRHGMVDGIAGAVRVGSDQVGLFSIAATSACTAAAKEQAMERFFLHTARLFDRVREQLLVAYNVNPIVLTDRQREALQLTLRGASRREASRAMRCSESNFVRHQEAARRKLGENTNLDAVRKAVAMNLIRPYDELAEDSASP